MEGSENVKTDYLLRQLGGCGIFQVIHGTCIALAHISMLFSVIFMVFGIYNPGWRCMDNSTTRAVTNTSLTTLDDAIPWQQHDGNSTSHDFIHTCEGFSECQHVVFSPEAKTVATEWGLVCQNSWISGIMFSLQMAGGTIGTLMGGYLGDVYGRKLIFYLNLFIQGVLTLLSVVSPQWQMFAVLRFFIGVSQGMAMCITYIYIMEFSTARWRVMISSLPFWSSGCVLFFSCALALKDWKHLHIVCGIFMLLFVLPAIKLPESLRWLIIKNKQQKALNAVSTISKINRVDGPSDKVLECLEYQQQQTQQRHGRGWKNNLYNLVRLFKKETRVYTIVLAVMFFCFNFIYFTTTFGITAFSGDFYINNIIVYSMELPANIIVVFIANIFGRKPSGVASNVGQALSFFVCVALDRMATGIVREKGMLAFMILARICLNMNWYIAYTCTCELYPTVMRTVGVGWIVFWSGIGSAVSPYVIKIQPDSTYIFFTVMGCLSLLVSVSYWFLPETKGKDLEDDVNRTSTSVSTVEMEDVEDT